MANILWVEDQFHWIDKLENTLRFGEFAEHTGENQVQIFNFSEAACQHIRTTRQAPDIAILDANLNGNDAAGFNVSRALIKKWPELPIIYLSEHSGTHIEQQALDQLETRDFIAKHQQNIEEVLCWRIKAALRHAAIKSGALTSNKGDIITSGELSIDLSTWQVYWHGQKLMNPKNPQRPLAPIPRKILKVLVTASPRPLSTSQIAELLELENFNYASYRQHIKTLRYAFEQIANQIGLRSFIEQCRQGGGIATFGDEGAYCWKPLPGETHAG